MKIFLTLMLTLTLVSCDRKVKTPKQHQERIRKEVKKELDYGFDKIILLANIEGIDTDKVYDAMKGYFETIYNDDVFFEKREDYQTMINVISKNTGLSNKKVCSLIFAYVYEMRTKEEIGDEYIEELQDAEEQYNDVYEPR